MRGLWHTEAEIPQMPKGIFLWKECGGGKHPSAVTHWQCSSCSTGWVLILIPSIALQVPPIIKVQAGLCRAGLRGCHLQYMQNLLYSRMEQASQSRSFLPDCMGLSFSLFPCWEPGHCSSWQELIQFKGSAAAAVAHGELRILMQR